jgi:hypothetical protein
MKDEELPDLLVGRKMRVTVTRSDDRLEKVVGTILRVVPLRVGPLRRQRAIFTVGTDTETVTQIFPTAGFKALFRKKSWVDVWLSKPHPWIAAAAVTVLAVVATVVTIADWLASR